MSALLRAARQLPRQSSFGASPAQAEARVVVARWPMKQYTTRAHSSFHALPWGVSSRRLLFGGSSSAGSLAARAAGGVRGAGHVGVGGRLALQSKGFSTGRLLVGLVRVPAIVGGSVAAGAVYVQYKVEQGAQYTKDVFAKGADWAAAVWQTGRQQVEAVTELSLPEFELPDWLQKVLRIEPTSEGFEKASGRQQAKVEEMPQHGRSGRDDGDGGKQPEGGGGAAMAAAVGVYLSKDGTVKADEDGTVQGARDDQMMVLTRKMIEIRNLLKQIDKSETLTLPSIVVVGSQSSGKSSVLESIVGHEFLPKGSNMVTRRPIELTLVNTPGATSEYGTFPALGVSKITDFSQIQATLTSFNRSVSDEECVSDDPIQLHIYSPNVPDLTLIDLPGYIQVQSKDQPANLKWKIADLCERYIKEPNIILAVCAADVDLANSPALKASRRVDPLGIRTLGVVTKMDLVTADRGASILKDSNYPLSLGYVGVVCRTPAPAATSLFNRRENVFDAMTRNERQFFGQSAAYAPEGGCKVGTATLRRSLMQVLERSMADSLQSTSDAIRMELEEAQYQFKVQYNDRALTSETYVADTLDRFKLDFKQFSEKFGKLQVREMLRDVLDQKVLDLLAERYWSDSKVLDWAAGLNTGGDSAVGDAVAHWERKLDASQAALTRMGVGRVATQLVTSKLAEAMEGLASSGPLRAHAFAREIVENATRDILNARYHGTSEQVENCIKPYKFEVDVEQNEWAVGLTKAQRLLGEELRMCQEAYAKLGAQVGSRQLGRVMEFVETGRDTKESMGYSATLLEKGKAGAYLRDRETLLKLRLKALKSRTCAKAEGKYACPEVFLSAVSQKLSDTAVLFINVELLSEFFYQFPREIDTRLVHGLSAEQVDRFAREDPRVRQHIDLQRKKELLQMALAKIEAIVQLEKEKKQRLAASQRDKGGGRDEEAVAQDRAAEATKRSYWA